MQTLARPRMIPPTLLTRPLAPEKINLMNDDEKRLYQIQKGKYDSYVRAMEKRSAQGENPANRIFTLKDIDKLMEGKHFDEIEEDEEVETAFHNQMYLGRTENFAQHKL